MVDVLRRGGVEVVTAAIGGSVQVRGAHGVTVGADALFSDVADGDFDVVALPGGGEGTENLKKCEALIARLRLQKERGKLLAAICAAPTVLVEAGVVDQGLHVTCYPSMQMELDRPWAAAPVVADGDVITGQAPGSAMLFSLVVLSALAGDSVAHKVARGMVTDFE